MVKNNKLYIIALILAAALGYYYISFYKPENVKRVNAYENSFLGYKIDYPSDWTIKENTPTDVLIMPSKKIFGNNKNILKISVKNESLDSIISGLKSDGGFKDNGTKKDIFLPNEVKGVKIEYEDKNSNEKHILNLIPADNGNTLQLEYTVSNEDKKENKKINKMYEEIIESFDLRKSERVFGVLEGKADVRPLCPVERIDNPCDTNPLAYTSREIIVYFLDNKTIIAKKNFDESGNYRIELPPGNYIVDIKHSGIDRASEVPKEISIKNGETVNLDITIDTGIR